MGRVSFWLCSIPAHSQSAATTPGRRHDLWISEQPVLVDHADRNRPVGSAARPRLLHRGLDLEGMAVVEGSTRNGRELTASVLHRHSIHSPLTIGFSEPMMEFTRKAAHWGRLDEKRIAEGALTPFPAFRFSSLVDCRNSLTIDVDDAFSIDPRLLAQPDFTGCKPRSPQAVGPVCAEQSSRIAKAEP